MSKTILVTGGAGYIGSATAFLLAQNGYEVIVYDNLSHCSGFEVPWASFVHGDIRDPETLDKLFSDRQVWAVVHTAALINAADSVSCPFKYYSTNLCGTLTLLQAMAKRSVKNFVFSSSAAVYGQTSAQMSTKINEESRCDPMSPYGKSKLFSEQLLQDFYYSAGINSVALRYFNVAGAAFGEGKRLYKSHKSQSNLIPLVSKKILKSEPVEVFGFELDTPDGSPIRDYVHLSDVASANLLALSFLGREKKSVILNIATGKGVSVLEIISEIEKVAKKRAIVKQAPPRIGDPAAVVGDSKKAYELLGWKAEYSDLGSIISSALSHEKIL